MSKNMLTNHRFPCITLLPLVRRIRSFSNGHAAKIRRFSWFVAVWRAVFGDRCSPASTCRWFQQHRLVRFPCWHDSCLALRVEETQCSSRYHRQHRRCDRRNHSIVVFVAAGNCRAVFLLPADADRGLRQSSSVGHDKYYQHLLRMDTYRLASFSGMAVRAARDK